MKNRAAATTISVLSIALLTAWWTTTSHDSSPAAAESLCTLTIELVEAESGRLTTGLIRITTQDGKSLELKGLQSRGMGMKPKNLPIYSWWVVDGRAVLQVPQKELVVEAFRGIETVKSTTRIYLGGLGRATARVELHRFHDAAADGYHSGNTHLHLMKLTRDQSDRYLAEIPRADDLDILFVSYLERVIDDREYITNFYTQADFDRLSGRGLIICNGEEHRNNFSGYGEGFGHVMFLKLQQLVLPVSIGPGIMKAGTDRVPLQMGIDNARSQGATVVWCHNEYGLEDLPNLISDRLDAQNIFDGSINSSYKDTFYRYLNMGLHVPFSTGTDWFIYDFSRVYVKLSGPLTLDKWLEGLAAGRTYITNGPHLDLRVGEAEVGDTIDVQEPTTLKLVGRVTSRDDFGRVEVIRNGEVIAQVESEKKKGHYVAHVDEVIEVRESCWLAIRTPPPPLNRAVSEDVFVHEFGGPLFSHTSPVYVDYQGKGVFEATIVKGMVTEIEKNITAITEHGSFANVEDRERVLDVHRQALDTLRNLPQPQD